MRISKTLSRLIRAIKLQIYPILYKPKCIDSAYIEASRSRIVLIDEVHTARFVREKIVSSNNVVLEGRKVNTFSQPCLEVFNNVVIETPYGFPYTDGKLICPSGWSLKNLFACFPMKPHITSSHAPCQNQYEVEAFYLIGPTSHNYYHWVVDKLVMVRSYIFYRDNYNPACKLLCPLDAYPSFYEMLSCFGVKDSDLLKWNYEKTGIRKLVVSSNRKSRSDQKISDPKALSYVKNILLDCYHRRKVSINRPQKLFISRRDAVKESERISNSNALSKTLLEFGFEEVSLTKYTFFEQIDLLLNAKIIVAIHGAALTNTMFCQSDSLIIEILPTSSPPRFYKDIADVFELNHKIFSVDGNAEGEYKLDIKEFLAVHKRDLL